MFDKAIITIIVFLSIFCTNLSATGPSYIESRMNPIAINNKGDILCRTKYLTTPMGGHYLPEIEYGLCIITKDSILFQKSYILEQDSYFPENWDEANPTPWDSTFHSKFDIKRFTKNEKRFIEKYKFNNTNLEKYIVNDTISMTEFKAKTQVDLTKIFQPTLHGAKGYFEPDCPNVDIKYNFGHIILIQNNIDWGSEAEDYQCISGIFEYPDLIAGATTYEHQKITSVVFVKPENNKISRNIDGKRNKFTIASTTKILNNNKK